MSFVCFVKFPNFDKMRMEIQFKLPAAYYCALKENLAAVRDIYRLTDTKGWLLLKFHEFLDINRRIRNRKSLLCLPKFLTRYVVTCFT